LIAVGSCWLTVSPERRATSRFYVVQDAGISALQHTGSYWNSHDGHSHERHIEFHCEDCGKDAAFELIIKESKGKVFVEWREPQWKTDFVTDCARVAEGLISYNQLQSKYKLSLAEWVHVAKQTDLSHAVQAERKRRTRNGTAAPEVAAKLNMQMSGAKQMGDVVDLNGRPVPLGDDISPELVADLARYAEGVLTEEFIRMKYRLAESAWEALGDNDALVEAVEVEKISRIRDGSTKREKSQQLITQAPDS
jgi:hypothetical protein